MSNLRSKTDTVVAWKVSAWTYSKDQYRIERHGPRRYLVREEWECTERNFRSWSAAVAFLPFQGKKKPEPVPVEYRTPYCGFDVLVKRDRKMAIGMWQVEIIRQGFNSPLPGISSPELIFAKIRCSALKAQRFACLVAKCLLEQSDFPRTESAPG